MRVSTTGGNPEKVIGGVPSVGVGVKPIGGDVKLLGNEMYWTDGLSGDGGDEGGRIMRAELDGGKGQTLAAMQPFPGQLALSSQYVYWVNTVDIGSLMRAELDGGSPIPLSCDDSFPNNVALDATHVYWSSSGGGGNGDVRRAQLDGTKQETLGHGVMVGLAIDESFVYWLDFGSGSNGAIVKLPKAGGAAVTLQSGINNGFGIAVDSSSVYWSEINAIKRVGLR